jgi:asparagine synthase (glutamine-hydrolysing)
MHIEYVAPTAREMVAALDKTLEAQESPFSSLSIVAQYILYQRVRACGVKVLLGGQGGDEVFMGYKKFLIFQ